MIIPRVASPESASTHFKILRKITVLAVSPNI